MRESERQGDCNIARDFGIGCHLISPCSVYINKSLYFIFFDEKINPLVALIDCFPFHFAYF